MDMTARPAYRPLTPTRRQEVAAAPGGYRAALLFALTAVLSVLLLQQQQQHHCQAQLIHAGYGDDADHPHHEHDFER